ncbi:MAG: ABC transporter ATP-binding protein [archaeon]|nr:ABC transporter ATP-binding protein [archaeon]
MPKFQNLEDDNFDELGRLKKVKREMSDFTVLKKIFLFVGQGKYKKMMLILILISILGAFLGFFPPYLMGLIVDEGLTGGFDATSVNAGIIQDSIIILAVTSVFSILCWFVQSFLIKTLANRSMYEMRKDLYGNLQNLSFDWYNKPNRSTGKVISYLTNDVETLEELIGSGILSVLGNVFGLFGSLGLMIIISWQLTLVSFLVVPVIGGILVVVFTKARRFYILLRRKVASITGHLNESISGMRVIKAFAVEKTNYHKFDVLTDAELSVNLKAQKLFSVIPAVMILIIGGGLSVIMIAGGILALDGLIGTGSILSFILYLMNFMFPLVEIMSLFSLVQNSMSAGERIIKTIETKSTVSNKPNAQKLPKVKGEINFSDVNFQYLENQPIIRDFDLKIKPNERVAIIGYTGAGKTTLINLLCRFYDVNTGKIEIDGFDIKDVTLHSLRSQIGLVLQDNLLFSGSVKDNIRYGRPSATDDEVIEVARKVGAHEYILDLPNGYESEVREFGNLLSVGQKQLVAFARALLIDPPILILDEATSAVDPYSEIIIQQALETLLRNRTSISIAHRLSTIINSDRIIVMKNGKIAEVGNHKELLEYDGLYKHLFLMQFKDAFKKNSNRIEKVN